MGHGLPSEISSGQALEIARNSTSQSIPQFDAGSIKIGEIVEVLPTDYGIDPTRGAPVTCNDEEIAIRRTDERAGEVIVHFPRLNYELRKAAT